MTNKLPRVSASEAIRALEKAGYFLVRQSGSHRIYSETAAAHPRSKLRGIRGAAA